MAITKIITPDLIDLPFNNTDGIVLAKGTTSNTLSIQYLVVAGGGGAGGTYHGGGGGAGGLRTSYGGTTGGNVSPAESNKVVVPGTYDILVGTGGAGGPALTNGNNGNNSQFDDIISLGGGRGGAYVANPNGSVGGSGGGSGLGNTGLRGSGGAGTNVANGNATNQGLNGGNGSPSGSDNGGGGGGAGVAGQAGGSYGGGDGGNGLEINIIGGSGGGGTGSYSQGTNGVNGKGGGGGGSERSGGNYSGGNGGSGVIILRTSSSTTAVFSGGVTANGSTGGSIAPDTSTGDNVWIVTATTNSTQTVTFSATGDGTGRPTTNISDGEFRYNTTTKKVEFYDGTAWFALTSSVSVPQAGTTGVCNYPTTATALYQLESNGNDTCGNYNSITDSNVSFGSGGKFGNAVTFSNNTNSYIRLPTTADFNPSNNYSWSVWIKPTSLSNDDSIIVFKLPVFHYIALRANGQLNYYTRTSGSLYSAIGVITTGSWIHVAVTKSSALINGKAKIIYVNGAEVASNTDTSDVQPGTNSNGSNNFGVYDTTGTNYFPFDGQMDQIRIFPSVLTPAQVTALYTETVS